MLTRRIGTIIVLILSIENIAKPSIQVKANCEKINDWNEVDNRFSNKLYCYRIAAYKESGVYLSIIMGVNYFPKRLAILALWIGTLALFGCSQKEASKAAVEKAKYEGWQYSTYGNIKIFHPPNHPLESKFEALARSYIRDIDEISRLLGIETPQDTLVVYYYTGYGQGREMTGREYPFVKDGIIYFWQPSFLGPTLVDRMLPYWVKGEPKYTFLKHGLRSIFDYSGQNYHKTTLNYLRDTLFEPLARLVSDTTTNSDIERLQSAEAASFVAFILANYGAARLKTMYQSSQPFDEMSTQLFLMPVDSLQADWLKFVRESVPPDTTADSSAQK